GRAPTALSSGITRLQQRQESRKARSYTSPIEVVPPNDARLVRVLTEVQANGSAHTSLTNRDDLREVSNVRDESGVDGPGITGTSEYLGLRDQPLDGLRC